MSEQYEYSPKRFAIASVVCPSCRSKLDRKAKWCETCHFSGSKSLEMFGNNPPPLLPILDVADFWNAKQLKKVKSSISGFKKRFPQFNWRVSAVSLDHTMSLPLFGFWLMNACPLLPKETEDDRGWTVLLLIDASSGRTSITTGYHAEVWLSNEMWESALLKVDEPYRKRQNDKVVTDFLNAVTPLMQVAWERAQKSLK